MSVMGEQMRGSRPRAHWTALIISIIYPFINNHDDGTHHAQ